MFYARRVAQCSQCLGEVPDEAKRCMHCGHRFDTSGMWLWIAIAIGIALALGVAAAVNWMAANSADGKYGNFDG